MRTLLVSGCSPFASGYRPNTSSAVKQIATSQRNTFSTLKKNSTSQMQTGYLKKLANFKSPTWWTLILTFFRYKNTRYPVRIPIMNGEMRFLLESKDKSLENRRNMHKMVFMTYQGKKQNLVKKSPVIFLNYFYGLFLRNIVYIGTDILAVSHFLSYLRILEMSIHFQWLL